MHTMSNAAPGPCHPTRSVSIDTSPRYKKQCQKAFQQFLEESEDLMYGLGIADDLFYRKLKEKYFFPIAKL